jgi:hypothetical protein
MSTICMKLDPGIHIGMYSVCFSKTRCDKVVSELYRRFSEFLLFRGYFFICFRVCSMMSLSTPYRSLADQAKTSLFLFKNCMSLFFLWG